MIKVEKLKELLEYIDGELYWKEDRKPGIKKGDRAGGVDIIKGKPYRKLTVCGNRLKYHRVVFAIFNGRFPKDEIDHVDGNGLNNKIENLREVTRLENMKNRKMYINNASGMSGVNWHKINNKWNARISVNNKRIALGSFDLLDDAISAKKIANLKYGYHKNHGMIRPL